MSRRLQVATYRTQVWFGSCVTSNAGPHGGCVTVREMKEGPSGSAIRSLIPSHCKLLSSSVTGRTLQIGNRALCSGPRYQDGHQRHRSMEAPRTPMQQAVRDALIAFMAATGGRGKKRGVQRKKAPCAPCRTCERLRQRLQVNHLALGLGVVPDIALRPADIKIRTSVLAGTSAPIAGYLSCAKNHFGTPMTGPSGRPRRQGPMQARRPVSQVAVGALLYCSNKDRSMASAIALYPASFG